MGHLGAFLTAAAGMTKEKKQEILDEIADLEQRRSGFLGRSLSGDDQRALAALDKQLAALKQQLSTADALKQTLAITSASSAGAFASAIAGSFQKMVGAGMDPAEALKSVEPAVLALQAQLDKLGIDGGAAFQSLKDQIAMTKDEVAGPSVSAMRSLGMAIADLYNGGVLTSDMFVGMANQIGETFQRLIAQGKDGKTAMALMKPQLQQIWELQQRYGVELDENTQKLLDEAEAAGIVGEAHKSAQERTVDGINRVVDRLDALLEGMGIKLPEAIGKAAETVVAKAGTIKGEIDAIIRRVPTLIPIDVDLTYTEINKPPSLDGRERESAPGPAEGAFGPQSTSRVTTFTGPATSPALAGTLAAAGVTPSAERGGITVVPLAVFYADKSGLPLSEINRHLASEAGVMSNEFGLREVVEHIATHVARREMARG
jgi:hypothetical protein